MHWKSWNSTIGEFFLKVLNFVHCYRSLFIFIDPCSFLSILVHFYRSLFISIDPCSFSSIFVQINGFSIREIGNDEAEDEAEDEADDRWIVNFNLINEYLYWVVFNCFNPNMNPNFLITYLSNVNFQTTDRGWLSITPDPRTWWGGRVGNWKTIMSGVLSESSRHYFGALSSFDMSRL